MITSFKNFEFLQLQMIQWHKKIRDKFSVKVYTICPFVVYYLPLLSIIIIYYLHLLSSYEKKENIWKKTYMKKNQENGSVNYQ